MDPRRAPFILLVSLVSILPATPGRAQDSELGAALSGLYATCLFEGVQNNPFSQAAALARQALGPGLSSFIESNLAAIPLTPPSLDAEYSGGEIVTVVTGFTPIFTESSATVGGGRFFVGTNFSHFSLSKIRGEDLSDLQLAFEQNGGGDIVFVTMPFNVDASVFTLHGTYGLTDRLDVGVALPVVWLNIDHVNTTFSVNGDRSNCRYGETLNCEGLGVREVSPPLNLVQPDLPESEVYLNTVALRAKYRFPTSMTSGTVAAVVDVRLPVGRSEESLLGKGSFGTRLTLIGEYDELNTFKPYVNVGAQFWNGDDSNSLKLAAGFTQRVASVLFFAFDLLGELDIEDPDFLAPLDDALSTDQSTLEVALAGSTIPSVDRDHTLNAGLGLQFAFSPSFHVYGSALFSLLDRGLQSAVSPTFGAALYF